MSEKAYLVVQTYFKFNGANELISMLGAIAKKPLSIAELIQKSDTAAIINMVNKKDDNQAMWFKALFTTQVSKNQEALDCINIWAHLCNEDDVTLLLNLAVDTNNKEFHKLVIKCASCLTMEKLLIVCTRHFYRNKFSHILNENITTSLTILFNKLNEKSSILDDLQKEVILLLLQNPMTIFTYIKNECVKNKFYTDCFLEIFDKIKEISKIDNIGVTSMKGVLGKIPICDQNLMNYAYLFDKLVNIGYITKEDLILKILLPKMKNDCTDNNLNELICILQLFMVSKIKKI